MTLAFAAIFISGLLIGLFAGGVLAAHANLIEARRGRLSFGDEHFACTPVDGAHDARIAE